MKSDKVRKAIRESICDEKDDIKEYAKAAKLARAKGDKKAAKLFSHIRNQETHHKTELTKMLKKTGD